MAYGYSYLNLTLMSDNEIIELLEDNLDFDLLKKMWSRHNGKHLDWNGNFV